MARSDTSDRSDTLQPANRIDDARALRLRQAVKAAGGNNRVSERSGIPLGSLGNYLRGRDFQTETLIALADACGVSIEWLATGRGGVPVGPGKKDDPPASSAESRDPPLFSIVDMELLAAAIDGASALFTARGAEQRGKPFAQIICLLYDEARERMLPSEQKSG